MKVIYSKDAVKAVSRMDASTQRRIREALAKVPEGHIVPLKGSDGSYRLRVGDWRILFHYGDDGRLYVEKIGPRGDVYKGG